MEVLGGRFFSVAGAGESHGPAITTIVNGCPAGLPLSRAQVQRYLDRRRPGGNKHGTPRQEKDRAEILSGLFEGYTLGSPIAVVVRNEDARPEAYAHMKDVFRPSHAD